MASEPEIFWRGENVDTIIQGISIPDDFWKLEVARHHFNGPSGIALDNYFLSPLGISRNDAWICDLVPHSCMNKGQQEAIKGAYLPHVQRHKLPLVSVPNVPTKYLDEQRCEEILEEILEEIHKPEVVNLILLGAMAIKLFSRFYDS